MIFSLLYRVKERPTDKSKIRHGSLFLTFSKANTRILSGISASQVHTFKTFSCVRRTDRKAALAATQESTERALRLPADNLVPAHSFPLALQ